MTRFRDSEPQANQGHLASLAEAAVQTTLQLSARIAQPIERVEDLAAWLAEDAQPLGVSLSREMVELALANAGDASAADRANKLAFQMLTVIAASPVAQLLSAVAERSFRRAGPALGPYLDANDLLSLIRWKLWTLPADHFAPTRILKHPGLAAYVSVIARRIVIDECRAFDNRTRTGTDPETLEASVDPRATLANVLDDLDLLQRLESEFPDWQKPLVDVLAGQAERQSALRAINRAREAAGLSPWSAEAMRTGVHRARKRLRELLTQAPSSRSAASAPREAIALPLHAWRRFWSLRDGTYSLQDDGFLVDPEDEYGRHVHDVVALDRMAEVPCLVLLGEPGIGKSSALRQEHERLRAEGQQVILVDLARTTTADALRAVVQHASSTGGSVALFFDALDEGIARNPALALDLFSAIDQTDLARVRMRVACRTLEWPAALEAQLQQRFGAEQLRVYELLPLRRIDVIAAANDHGVDGVAFVREIRERDATALAIRPISLRFLLAMYLNEGALPHSRQRLFDEGTLILCSEEGALQRGRGRRNPDVFRRRAIAARLAALTTLTNCDSITRSADAAAEGVLPAQTAASGPEKLPDATYAVDLPAVEDLLTGTALFTARTTTTYGWSHQTYREFLAGWYLAQHGVGAEGAERLYFPSALAPVPVHLREVAAWHATFVPALFDLLVERDPDVLLHSDSAAVLPEARAQLVRALLDRMARFEALDGRYYRRDYQKLAHPGLAKQLRPYIKDRKANRIVRRAAMDIAWACGVTDVIDELLAVLVDRDEELHVREVAARALGELGGGRVRDAFLALLSAGIDPDPNDGIRGSILACLWPDHIDSPTLFRHLSLPQRDDYLGPYQRFLDELSKRLAADDLRLALEWVEAIEGHGGFHLEHAQHDIIDRALRYVERDDVRAVLVRLIRRALHSRRGAWFADGAHHRGDERSLSDRDRELLSCDLIRLDPDDERLGSALVHFDPPLIGPGDAQWIAELAATNQDQRVQRACGRCVAAIYARYDFPTDAVVADAVVSVELPAFREPLRPFLDPVEIGSQRARELADASAYRHRVPRRDAREPRQQAPEPARWSIAGPCLERFETGDLTGWTEFAYRWTNGLWKPIDKVSEWSTLASADRERVILAALRFVQQADAPDPAWLDDSTSYPYIAAAARAALQLVAESRPAMLDAISEAAWRRWCPVLVGLSFPEIAAQTRTKLIEHCARYDELASAIVRLVRRDNRPGAHVSVLRELPEPLPEPLHASVLALVPELDDSSFEDALGLLVSSGSATAAELARVTLRDTAPERAARAARVILPYDATQWSIVAARMQREAEFIAAFAPLVAYHEDMRANVFATLHERHAAEVYLALLRSRPSEETRGRRGRLVLGDHVERLGQRMRNLLVGAGTGAAIDALRWLIEQEPKRETLRYLQIEARQKHADVAWRPLSLDDIWTIVGINAGGRIEPTSNTTSCVAALRPDSDADAIAGRLTSVAGITSLTVSPQQVLVEISPQETATLALAIEMDPSLRASILSMRAGDEFLFEALPSIEAPKVVRRDAGHDEVRALLARAQLLVETATNTETAAVHAAMTPLPGENALVVGSLGFSTYTIGLLGNYAVAHLQSDMGSESPNAAMPATIRAINEVQPKLVLLIGIAFGLQRSKQRLGDVLVAQHVKSYEMVKLKPDAIEERGETLRADAMIVERIHAHGRTWQFPRADGSHVAFQVGLVVSGAKLVNNREFRDELARRFPIALGGEMEGVGAYAAAFGERVPVLLAKGICDWADGTKNDRAQAFAAAAAVDLIRHVLGKPDSLAAFGVPVSRG